MNREETLEPDVFKYLTTHLKVPYQTRSEKGSWTVYFSYLCAPLLDSALRGRPFLRLAETASQVLGMKIQNTVLCVSSMPGSVSEEGRWTSKIKTL